MLKRSQITREKIGMEEFFFIHGIVGSVDFRSKNSIGGWNVVKIKLKQMKILNRSERNRIIKIYKDISDYLSFRPSFLWKWKLVQYFSSNNRKEKLCNKYNLELFNRNSV